MLRMTDQAAAAIVSACRAHRIPSSGGLRIAPIDGPEPDTATRSLFIDFVDDAAPSDTRVHRGDASVLLADGVERLLADQVLDIDGGAKPPQLVVRDADARS